MHCHEFEHRLNDLLDRRIAPDDDSHLCSHAHRCRECAELMSAHLAVTAALKDLRPDGPDETFPFAVMNRWEAAADATSMGATGMGATGKRSLPVQRDEPPVACKSNTPAHGQAVVAFGTPLLARATRPKWLVGLVVTAAAALVAFTLWRGTTDPIAPTDVTSSPYDRLAEETQELATLVSKLQSELAEGFKPVTTSFGAAYDALRQAMPDYTAAANAKSG